jgi:hypothetical protein
MRIANSIRNILALNQPRSFLPAAWGHDPEALAGG